MVDVGVDVTAMTESRAGWRSSFAGGLVGTARPKQWVKNLLVFAAPGAAGVLTHGHAAVDALAAFVIFCIVASGVYFINDALDVEADRAHPRKRFRPVAAGVIGARQAQAVGAALVTVGVALSALVAVRLLVVLAIYVGVQVAYSVWLKHEPVLDLAAVAAGFVLRAIAGAVAVGVPISQWFLIVATFGSLFMVTGKRISDLAESGGGLTGGGSAGGGGVVGSAGGRALGGGLTGGGSGSAVGRAVAAYSVAFLRSVLVMSATVTITAYCLWAFENVKAVTPGEGTAAVCFQLSIVPFTLALMRYGLLVDQGQGGAPEDLVLGDRLLVVLAVIWAVVFAVGVYR
ncbi:MAG: decaprenyl-phosphate phosphoribosyltransferase [Acidimicrobiaceae bacterium]|nr:decaprenyl-phosphate phosphoribosyltransferase [Acidimicrobiaceae bacterium]